MSAGRVSLIDESEIELLLHQVGTCNLNGYTVAELIAAIAATAYEAVVFLVELVIVVFEVADRHQSFTLVLVDFHIESPLGHARDGAFIHLSEPLAKELHLLILDRGTLGTGGKLFHVA